ncbi:TetR/AcrR family transcriptional regulator [Candidatus Frankia alpina]|uniref:TetR/AcrR family transcriptional regulator n=1 Tax=Candidatus Frankia alpina TaxID=2699483 RepID=UPI0013D28985|nr:TetR/AcrR family transcriptional regulator [Candidatus Frankia alpina]
MNPPSKNVERGAAPREHLLGVATRLFAERGYEGTSIDAVLTATGVSRGSLYHHFKGKDALFDAVLEAVELDVGRRLVAAVGAGGGGDPATALRLGCLAWIGIAGDPVVRRILLIDAPGVLGWARWRELDERHAFGKIKQTVAELARDGVFDAAMVDLFAHVLLASMNEIALLVARADNQRVAIRQACAAVDELLRRLLRPT